MYRFSCAACAYCDVSCVQVEEEPETASFAALKDRLFQPVYPGAPMLLVQVSAVVLLLLLLLLQRRSCCSCTAAALLLRRCCCAAAALLLLH